MGREAAHERSGRLCNSSGCELDADVGGQAYCGYVGNAVCDVRDYVGQDGKMEGILEGRNACDIDNDAYTKRKWFATFVLLFIRVYFFVFKI